MANRVASYYELSDRQALLVRQLLDQKITELDMIHGDPDYGDATSDYGKGAKALADELRAIRAELA